MTACVWQDSYGRKKDSYIVTYLDSWLIQKKHLQTFPDLLESNTLS